MDSLGPINIPDPIVIQDFPLQTDYGAGFDYTPPIATHVFDQAGLKTEQRYLLGSGARRFRVVRSRGLACNELNNLKAHFQLAQGQAAQFNYTHRRPDGPETVVVRYENPNIQFDHLVGMLARDPGITLVEVQTATAPYFSSTRLSRFPDTALNTALTSQTQQFIPLIKIQPRTPPPTPSNPNPATPAALYVSNQRCTVNGQLFLPRLLEWSGISQSISEASDSATFTMGNADDVWVKLGNIVNLYRASVQFSLFHVNTNYLIDFWAGYAKPWVLTSDGRFVIPCSDALYELSVPYPSRTLARTCWKVYRGRFCPASTSNGFPDCPKDYDSCVARGVPKSFGGVVALPQTVRIKDNSTGVLGFGRSIITSVSIGNDSVYQRPIQEVYTDEAMPVNCDIAVGRDEGEYYSALGIIGEGPIGSYSAILVYNTLDGQPPHDPLHGGGFRGILGTDPAGTSDFFGIDQAPWSVVPPNTTYAAGLAFAEIRRTDQAGLQLAPVTDRVMKVTITQGIGGWVWTAPGARTWQAGLANCVWVAVNVFLRGIGLRVDQARGGAVSPAQMEAYFDVGAAIAAAAKCDTIVNKLIGTGQERQFPFRGALKEQKPLKDWLTEILNCCLGYFTFANGKLFIGIRFDSSATNSFTRDTILYSSLQATPVAPQFNWLDGQFGDEEFIDVVTTGVTWELNTVSVYDIDNAGFIGGGDSPTYKRQQMSFVGISNKSQAARVVTTRLREELGGLGLDEQLAARNLQFKTTLLAMQTQCGDVISLDHDRLPNGRGEARVQKWTLNPDFSIDIVASCTTDHMYDLTQGFKPADVAVVAAIPETLPAINGLAWMPNQVAPIANDPLYPDPAERSFDLWQDYTITKDGVWQPAVWVQGEMVVNQFAMRVQPRILGAALAPGGTLAGPMTVYIAIGQHNDVDNGATGAVAGHSVPSNLIALWIPAGVAGQAVQLTVAPAVGSWAFWDLYAGNDRRRIGLQTTLSGAVSGTYTFTGPVHPMTREMPENDARKVRIKAKHVWHSGVAGLQVTSVPAYNQIQCDEFKGSPDNWIGRIVSALADFDDGSAPLWNFRVTGFDSASGTLTVTPNCVVPGDPGNSVEKGDVLIVRSTATGAGVNYVDDSLWHNSVAQAQFQAAGLAPNAEIGRQARVLRGTGAGQVRMITGNTTLRLLVEPDWDVVPDSTSVIIVEARDWDYEAETSDVNVPVDGVTMSLRLRVDNLVNFVILVGGFLVDEEDNTSDEEFAVYREIFVYGQPPGVRNIGPTTGDPATGLGWWDIDELDQTIRADTSLNTVQAHLLPLDAYAGRTLYFSNDNGPNQLVITAAPGELLFDGNNSLTLAPKETSRLTAG